jgi:hypothetical protein
MLSTRTTTLISDDTWDHSDSVNPKPISDVLLALYASWSKKISQNYNYSHLTFKNLQLLGSVSQDYNYLDP